MRSRRLALCLLRVSLALPGASAAETPLVLVVASDEAAAYGEAERGVREALAARAPHARLEIVGRGDPFDFRARAPSVVITLGNRALERVTPELGETPLVAGMVLRRAAFAALPNATGVELEFSAEIELARLAQLIPSLTRVGVLYNGAQNAERIREAQRAARAAGVELVLHELGSAEELPGALNGLAHRVDAIWGVPDEIALSAATARTVLTFAFANRIPISGLSDAWVKAGALYALDRDYRDVGRQCGELAAEILAGRAPRALEPQRPRLVIYSLNLRTYRRMGLRLPDAAVVTQASEVYE